MGKLEEIEARRQARRGALDEKRLAQEELDLEAIDALEESSGDLLTTLRAGAYVEGLPVTVALRAPSAIQYKRYADMVGRASAKNDPDARRKAQEMLAESCWAYPPESDKDTRKKMQESFPGLLLSIAIEAPKLAEMRAEQEGKG